MYAIVFLISCMAFTIYNYEQLAKAEGWGMVGMVYLFGFGLLLLLASIALHKRVKSNRTANIIGLGIAIITTIIIYTGFFK